MPPTRQSSKPPSALLLLLLSLITLLPTSVLATVSMQNVQPIVQFSTQCTNAYNTPISACSLNDFKGIGKSGSCSQDCFNDLNLLQLLIQQQCQGQQASGESLIGHFFTGNGADMLCGLDSRKTSTTTTTMAAAASTTSTTSSTSSSSTASSSSTSSSQSSTLSASTSTIFTNTSTATLPTSSTSTSTSTSSTSTSSQQAQSTGQIGLTGSSGGGSPFDITVPTNAGAACFSRSDFWRLGGVTVLSLCLPIVLTMR